MHAHTAIPINLEHKRSHYYQNQNNIHGWHKQSAFPPLHSDPVPEETNFNRAQNCVAAPISQQMQNPCADNSIILEMKRGMEVMLKQINSIIALLRQITQRQRNRFKYISG